MTAAPPSEICEALPAVMLPALSNAGRRPAERLGGGVAADALVGVEDHRVALALRDLDLDDLVVEQPVLGRPGGPLVRLGGAARPGARGRGRPRRRTSRCRRPWPPGRRRRRGRRTSSSRRPSGRRCGSRPGRRAAGTGAWVIDSMPPATTMSASPGLDHLVGQVDGVEARQAHLVDGGGGHGHRDAGVDGGLAGGDLAGAGLEHLAHEDVVDLLGR